MSDDQEPPTSPNEGSADEPQRSEAAASSPQDEPAALREEVDRLKAELERERARADENFSGWQRSQADFSNFRKRQEQDLAVRAQLAQAGLISALLPVLDDLERAWQVLPRELYQFSWIQGIDLIEQKLRACLASYGLSPIEALGKDFDPHHHEAVMTEEGNPAEMTTVVQEFQKGYKLHERVLRPALVKVGRTGPSTEANAGEREV